MFSWVLPWRRTRGKTLTLPRPDGLTQLEVSMLASYNAGRAAGVTYSAPHQAHMAELQARFDAPWLERQRQSQAVLNERVKNYSERQARLAQDSHAER